MVITNILKFVPAVTLKLRIYTQKTLAHDSTKGRLWHSDLNECICFCFFRFRKQKMKPWAYRVHTYHSIRIQYFIRHFWASLTSVTLSWFEFHCHIRLISSHLTFFTLREAEIQVAEIQSPWEWGLAWFNDNHERDGQSSGPLYRHSTSCIPASCGSQFHHTKVPFFK